MSNEDDRTLTCFFTKTRLPEIINYELAVKNVMSGVDNCLEWEVE